MTVKKMQMPPSRWAILSLVGLLGMSLSVLLPRLMPLYQITAFAFTLLAAAIIFDLLAAVSERGRGPLKVAGWLCLPVAAIVAISPLWPLLTGLWAIYRDLRSAGWQVHHAMFQTFESLGQYSNVQHAAMLLACGISFACIVIAALLVISMMTTPPLENNRASSTGPWKADWMCPADIAHLKNNKTGMPLAMHNGRLLRYVKNDPLGWRGGHHLVVAGTRGGKGVAAVIPTILDHLGPVVALDIKGENFAITRRHRQTLGRQVAVLNPFSLIEPSKDQFNPLDYIRPETMFRDIEVIADGLVKPEDGDGAHFSTMARQLVAAAIEVVFRQEEAGRRTLITVADLLLAGDLDITLQAWADDTDLVGRRPAQVAATILRAGDRERGSIQTSVAKAFAWMQSDTMRSFLQSSSFGIEDLLDDNLDLFVVVPLDQVDQQAVFMRLCINLVLGTVVRQDGRRKVKAPISLILDEFVRMGRMDQIMNIANVAAGAGVEALFVTQDIGQVQQAYGDKDAASIFGSCITKRLFNLNDVATVDWAVRHLGDSTVFSQQVREAKIVSEGKDFSYSEQGKKLMTSEEVLEMRSDQMLLLIGNRKPLIGVQAKYFDHQQYCGLFDSNPLN